MWEETSEVPVGIYTLVIWCEMASLRIYIAFLAGQHLFSSKSYGQFGSNPSVWSLTRFLLVPFR
jgi:hypothetical protein